MRKKDPSFEELFEELETTVQKLEAGNLTLDESLALYERGMQLAKQCGAQLDHAELRLKELAPALDEMIEEDAFAPDETQDE
jgi:exodeoxyribonuclease VII small subunit